ncbi:MAG: hypothetical protein JST54_05650 [Deltaproteobacteria bacterium]|nr:hypothetical protein [Deltaproteobacteria bacterium]
MGTLQEAIELESRHVPPRNERTLPQAFELLRRAWLDGERERELALHLMFLAFYLLIEPPSLTGLDVSKEASRDTLRMFREAHAWLLPDGAHSDDAEGLYVASLTIRLGLLYDGDNGEWGQRGVAYRARHERLCPNGMSPDVFVGRGYYGHYFAWMLQRENDRRTP